MFCKQLLQTCYFFLRGILPRLDRSFGCKYLPRCNCDFPFSCCCNVSNHKFLSVTQFSSRLVSYFSGFEHFSFALLEMFACEAVNWISHTFPPGDIRQSPEGQQRGLTFWQGISENTGLLRLQAKQERWRPERSSSGTADGGDKKRMHQWWIKCRVCNTVTTTEYPLQSLIIS